MHTLAFHLIEYRLVDTVYKQYIPINTCTFRNVFFNIRINIICVIITYNQLLDLANLHVEKTRKDTRISFITKMPFVKQNVNFYIEFIEYIQ